MSAEQLPVSLPPSSGPRRTVALSFMETLVGKELGCSEWRRIDQDMISAFAELTGDRNAMHVDEQAASATPFGGTIAHGFLTLSLLAAMAYEVCPGVEGARTTVNYGFNRLRFVAPVPSGSRVRGRFSLEQFSRPAPTRWEALYRVVVEIEGASAPALVAEWLTTGLYEEFEQ